MNKRKTLLKINIITIILVLLLWIGPTISAPTVPIIKFAEKIKYPLPAIPEPVLVGGNLEVHIKASKDADSWSAKLMHVFLGEYNLELVSTEFIENKGLWKIVFKVSNNIPKGLYNLSIGFKEDGQNINIVEPKSVWILKKWPTKLRFLVFGDTKTPGGKELFYEAIKEIDLINPDLAIFLGDLVERPEQSSAWKYFLGSFLLLRSPCYIVIGNHEYGSIGDASIYERIIGPQNYTVSIGDFLLIVLPTDADGWVRMNYLKWAENILKNSHQKFKIIAFHHPLFSTKVKGTIKSILELKSAGDINKLFNQGYIYYSWSEHPDEAKYLFNIIINYDVRLILAEHIHTDLNMIVKDWKGNKHYFITPAAVAYDVASKDIRGFKYLVIYSNGTIDENTIYYKGTGPFTYPNSIPIDSGEGVYPYKIGFIEYYYAPLNDGKHYAVSFKAKNELKETFHDIRIIFKLPLDKPIDQYKWTPSEPSYTVYKGSDAYYIVLENVSLSAGSTIKYTIYSVDDATKPEVNIDKSLKFEKEWTLVTINAKDTGWGVDEVSVKYSLDGGTTWKSPDLLDLVDFKNGVATYIAWIPFSKDDYNAGKRLDIKVSVKDFAGNSVEKRATFRKMLPKISLTINMPSNITLGSESVIQIVLKNTGNAAAKNVILNVSATDQLSIVDGGVMSFDTISPGESKSISVRIKGVSSGTATVAIEVSGIGFKSIRETKSIVITKPPAKIDLTISLPEKINVDEEATIQIVLKNTGNGVAENITVTVSTSSELSIISGSKSSINIISPGESKSISVRIKGVSSGTATVAIEVSGINFNPLSETKSLKVEKVQGFDITTIGIVVIVIVIVIIIVLMLKRKRSK